VFVTVRIVVGRFTTVKISLAKQRICRIVGLSSVPSKNVASQSSAR
jgi:hypothetical protein